MLWENQVGFLSEVSWISYMGGYLSLTFMPFLWRMLEFGTAGLDIRNLAQSVMEELFRGLAMRYEFSLEGLLP